jgi:hypothetical protein
MLTQLSADYFSRSPVLAMPVLALMVFLAVFVAVSLRALLGKREEQERMAQLPLEEFEVKHHG